MDRPLTLLLTLTIAAAAPIAAVAQTWPAAVVAAGPHLKAPTPQPPTRVDRDTRLLRRATRVPPTQPTLRLNLTPIARDDIPEIDIEAKDAWLDDQGLRVSPTRVAFKRRF